MGIIVKKETPNISKYSIDGDSTLYLGIDRHPFTMGKVIFFPDCYRLTDFKDREYMLKSPKLWSQVKGYNIVIMEDGTTGTPTLTPPETWEIQRDLNSIAEWYREQIAGNKSMNKKFKIK